MIERMPVLRGMFGDKYYFGLNETQMIEIDVCPNFDNSEVSVKIVQNKLNEMITEGTAKLLDVVKPK